VLAWMALLQGFRIRLVHAEVSEEGLRAVAKLYSELSHRGDPRWMELEVIRGETVAGALRAYIAASKIPVFAGFHSSGGEASAKVRGALAPLYLMPEERFGSEFESLGLWPYEAAVDWREQGAGGWRSMKFGGKAADVSAVLDGLH